MQSLQITQRQVQQNGIFLRPTAFRNISQDFVPLKIQFNDSVDKPEEPEDLCPYRWPSYSQLEKIGSYARTAIKWLYTTKTPCQAPNQVPGLSYANIQSIFASQR